MSKEAEGLSIHFVDLERFHLSFEKLERLKRRREVSSALKRGGNLLKKAGQQNLRARLLNTGKGFLLNSIEVRLKKRKKGEALIGFDLNGRHAHLVDRGTQIRTTKSGKNRGKMKGNSFWMDALSDNKSRVQEIVSDGIEKALENIEK